MKLSTRSRYGLRFMVELALNYGKEAPTTLNTASQNQNISEKYLSKLVIPLRKAGLVKSERGINGGCRLAKAPSEITLLEIIRPLEGGLEPVSCVKNQTKCNKSPFCPTRKIWCELDGVISDYLSSKKLSELIDLGL